MIKLSVNETEWSSLLARTGALIFYVSIWFRARKVSGTFEKRAPHGPQGCSRKWLPRKTGIELPRCLSGQAALHLSLLLRNLLRAWRERSIQVISFRLSAIGVSCFIVIEIDHRRVWLLLKILSLAWKGGFKDCSNMAKSKNHTNHNQGKIKSFL